MKIAVVCANGKAGKLIVKELVERKVNTTAIVRKENLSMAKQVIKKDMLDLTSDDLKDFDVVIDAFGTWAEETLFMHSTTLKHLCDILSGTNTRLLVVGGAGSLYINPEHTLCLSDGDDFPDSYKPVASAMAKALAELRNRNDVKWTYLSPAAEFEEDGKRTGAYHLGGEEFMVNENGESIISYADYAIAMVDEAINGNHIQKRISVISK